MCWCFTVFSSNKSKPRRWKQSALTVNRRCVLCCGHVFSQMSSSQVVCLPASACLSSGSVAAPHGKRIRGWQTPLWKWSPPGWWISTLLRQRMSTHTFCAVSGLTSELPRGGTGMSDVLVNSLRWRSAKNKQTKKNMHLCVCVGGWGSGVGGSLLGLRGADNCKKHYWVHVMHVCATCVLKSLVCYTLCSDAELLWGCTVPVCSVCVCVYKLGSLLWGSTWEREEVPRHWAFHRKTFHRLSKNPNDFGRH